MPEPSPSRDLTEYAARYAALAFEETQVEYRREVVLQVLAESGGRRILEIGCALHPLCNFATAFDRWTIVEPAPVFAEAARISTAGDARVMVFEDTIEGACARGTIRRGDHDVILLSSLLHEVPSPEGVLRGVHTLSDASTRVHVNVPNATSLHRELAVAMGIIPSVYEPSAQQRTLAQPRIYDIASLEALLVQTGFVVTARGGYLLKPFTHAQMQALVSLGTIDRSLLDGLHALGKKFPALASEIFVNACAAGPQESPKL